MKVHIEDNLYLESDSMQFMLREYTGKTDGTGKELFKSHGYFSTAEGAMKKVLKMKISESTATSLQELITEVKSIKQYIESKIEF